MKCKRCGQCCENMALGISPKELKEYWKNWHDDIKDTPRAVDVDLIYPMLIPLGFDKKVKRYRYKCKHFLKIKGVGACTIYDIRPKILCQGYGLEEKIKMGIEGSKNKTLYSNCVF